MTVTLALAGNPNCGKTTLFNALTGLRQKVANYPGITVERKVGQLRLADGREAEVIDLPGTYSLVPTSPDELVAAEVLQGRRSDTPVPEVVIAVIDASTLARGLFLVSQLLELRRPLVIALTMTDVAIRRGIQVDHQTLARHLGVPVVPVVGHRSEGIAALKAAISAAAAAGASVPAVPPSLADTLAASVSAPDPLLAEIGGRYAWIDAQMTACVQAGGDRHLSSRVDGILMHRIFGLGIFALIMAGLFVTLFTVAKPVMDACADAVTATGTWATSGMDAGPLKSLITDGVFAGVGAVVVFVPQIALLFLFLSLLEDSGYLARAAVLMDRVLCRVGLHGKSFIPLLSSFACAIPGIMATRTIDSRRERLVTILIAPFMSCSARLPVYALLIAAFFQHLAGWQQGLIMLSLYLLGIVAAFLVAWVGTKIGGRLASTPFILELPSYKVPQPRQVALQVWQNSSAFLTKAGTTIFALSIVIWAITTYPKPSDEVIKADQDRFAATWSAPADMPADQRDAARQDALDKLLAGKALEHSIAGHLGHAIEPVIAPLGFDWKMGIGLVGAFAAREVFVSTLGIAYAVGDPGEETQGLQAQMLADRRPDGSPVWTTAVAVSMLVWFVLAMQCISTTAVVRRETGGWTWPLLQLAGMNALAYVVCLIVYRSLA